ncbi:unnamed protein product, partial [Tuber aestivum]
MLIRISIVLRNLLDLKRLERHFCSCVQAKRNLQTGWLAGRFRSIKFARKTLKSSTFITNLTE